MYSSSYNDVTTTTEISRSRNLTLNFANNQLTEVMTNEYTFGLGYRFERMDLIIKTTADYMLSDRFQLRVYYDKVINKPFTSLSFPTSNTNFGMSFRFTLAQ